MSLHGSNARKKRRNSKLPLVEDGKQRNPSQSNLFGWSAMRISLNRYPETVTNARIS